MGPCFRILHMLCITGGAQAADDNRVLVVSNNSGSLMHLDVLDATPAEVLHVGASISNCCTNNSCNEMSLQPAALHPPCGNLGATEQQPCASAGAASSGWHREGCEHGFPSDSPANKA
mmetsp:Transcript_13151/g.36324  ORF Transcript_13151/g.36324 Transcript_13151/m.36324 type:complete len:118 (+) Transcript_13151:570-923(+)